MTNAELAILTLVVEKPRHGYEIEQVIEERGMRNWTEVGFSSIYYLLNKLKEKGLVTSQLEQPGGRGPTRKVFQITEQGLKVWYQAILGTLTTPERRSTSFLLGISSLTFILPEDTIQALEQYRESLVQQRDQVKQRWEEQSIQPLPTFVDAMFDYSATLIEAEINWISKFIKKLISNN